jgi:hypothetical protein
MRLRPLVLSGVLAATPFLFVLSPFVAADWFFFGDLRFEQMDGQGSGGAESSVTHRPAAIEVGFLSATDDASTSEGAEDQATETPVEENDDDHPIDSELLEVVPVHGDSPGVGTGRSAERHPSQLVEEHARTRGSELEQAVGLSPSMSEEPPSIERVIPLSQETPSEELVALLEEDSEDCIQTDPAQLRFQGSIRPLEDGTWYVPREMLNYYVSHPGPMRRLAGTYTWRDDAGVKAGFKIRPRECSLLLDAGFESGDVVRSINGITVATVPDAISAYLRLKGESDFELMILRDGEMVELTYELESRSSHRTARRTAREEERTLRREERRDRRKLKRMERSSSAVVTRR